VLRHGRNRLGVFELDALDHHGPHDDNRSTTQRGEYRGMAPLFFDYLGRFQATLCGPALTWIAADRRRSGLLGFELLAPTHCCEFWLVDWIARRQFQ
jgi:hypothetical protein